MRLSLVTIILLLALAVFPANGQSTQRGGGDAIPCAVSQQTSPESVGYSSAQLEDPPALGQPSDETSRDSKSADFNGDIYYRNKLEFSFEAGWLPVNVETWPLRYTLVPTIASLRWHVTG